MLTMSLTLASGEHVRIQVKQAEFVVECPYCKLLGIPDPSFLTIDPDQLYCKTSHRVRMSERRNIGIKRSAS